MYTASPVHTVESARSFYDAFDRVRRRFEFYAEVLDDGGGNALALADQSEQDVLGADVFVVQSRRFLARHRENLSNALGEVVSVHRQRSAQLLLICLQSSQINLHFRQPTRAEPQ